MIGTRASVTSNQRHGNGMEAATHLNTGIESKSEKFKPAEFQTEDLSYLIERDWSANWSEMGCIAGDAQITVLSASGKVNHCSLKDAYLGFNHLHPDKRKNWKSTEPYKTLAYVDSRIRHHEIEAITYSGIKWVIELELEDGRKIKLTPDHRVLLADEWVSAEELKVGEYIRVKGGKGQKHDSKRTGYKYVYFKEPVEGATKVVVNDNTYWKISEHRLVAGIPAGLHVHHIDETSVNNELGNLATITLEEHSRLHAKDQIGSYDAPPMRIVGVRDYGAVPTYDISMKAPYHSFVANGVVVHNCYKTTTALWLVQEKTKHIENPRVLIITTKSGKGTYFQTLPEVLPDWTVVNVNTGKTTLLLHGVELPYPVTVKSVPRDKPARPMIFISHYNAFSLRKKKGEKEGKPSPMLKMLLNTEWDVVILDEAHRIKGRHTAWTKQIKKVKAKYKHIMTGTGFINDPSEIWSLLHFLEKRIFSSYWAFRNTFCEEYIDDAGFRHVAGIKSDMVAEFRNLVRTVGPRRTKKEVFPKLPHPIETEIEVELNPIQRAMYDSIKDDLFALDQAGEPFDAPNVLAALSRMRQISVATPHVIKTEFDSYTQRKKLFIELVEPSSKLDALMEIIEGLEWDQDRKDQIVVFSNFKDPIKLAKTRFEKKGITYLEMKQADNDQVRYNKWAIEFPKKEHQVFICTLQLGSESISLTSATTAVFLDRSWSPKDNSQGVARVWRPGQEEVANIIYINAKNTVDQYILSKVNRKQGWFKQIFGTDEENADPLADVIAGLK